MFNLLLVSTNVPPYEHDGGYLTCACPNHDDTTRMTDSRKRALVESNGSRNMHLAARPAKLFDGF